MESATPDEDAGRAPRRRGGAEISSGGRVDRALGTDDFLHERGLVDEIKVTGAAGDAPGWMVLRHRSERRRIRA